MRPCATLLDDLRNHLPDTACFGGLDPRVGFEPWNPTTADWPLARVECRTSEEVATTLRIAADHGVPVTVCGGREDVFGRNSRAGCLVVDLRHMTDVTFHADRRIAVVGGGVTTSGLLGALPADTVAPTTANAHVGLAGAVAGGGYGALCGVFGLTCDALVEAKLVLADGRRVTANARQDPELFWGLRGGGSGFGVVTELSIETHRLPAILAAMITLPLASAREALAILQRQIDDNPEALGLLPFFISGDDGTPVLNLSFTWVGDPGAGGKVLSTFTGLPGAETAGGTPVPYRTTLDDGTPWPWGQRWDFDTRILDRITPEAGCALVDLASDMPRPGSALFLHDFHGQGARPAPGDTAFGLRRDHFIAMAAARWSSGDDAGETAQRRWIAHCGSRLAPLARSGGYVNFLDLRETDRVREFYGDAVGRLATLKASVDPGDMFRYATGRL